MSEAILVDMKYQGSISCSRATLKLHSNFEHYLKNV